MTCQFLFSVSCYEWCRAVFNYGKFNNCFSGGYPSAAAFFIMLWVFCDLAHIAANSRNTYNIRRHCPIR